MTAVDAHRAIEAVWRIESARLIAGLTRITRDVGEAEDLAADALLVALEKWPDSGVPDNPGAWLMSIAKRRAIDSHRRSKLLERKRQEIGYNVDAQRDSTVDNLDAAIDDNVGDDLLRLMFISCHPVLSTEARLALTLRLLGGLSTDEIARAFLAPEPTIAQRIVRAKRTLSVSKVPFEVPRGDEFTARLSSVQQVIYLIFNEGYSATAGQDWAQALERSGQHQEAQQIWELVRKRCEGAGDPAGEALVLEGIARCARGLGIRDSAIEEYQNALARAVIASDHRREVTLRNTVMRPSTAGARIQL